MPRKPKQPKTIASLKHGEVRCTNIQTAECQSEFLDDLKSSEAPPG